MFEDNSSNAKEWIKNITLFSGTAVESWVNKAPKDMTCRQMWLTCPRSMWLCAISRKLKTSLKYESIRNWTWGQIMIRSHYVSAEEFRQRCARVGCYGKG